jgi:hypothetical protein
MNKEAVKKTPLMKNEANLKCKGINTFDKKKKLGPPTKAEVYRS